ncbi:unnamed protein product [Psylliodes chrysocephalus]|uniref:Major facilitator superfamily (MFS) profile domain-containing protein n=1 Tax=Psylliodes chrysocephalus TaxID=3402493 RepID=A0A9P0D3T2_9CUCU|nr:unnamed protein product [Psylliodes chrysocephala]
MVHHPDIFRPEGTLTTNENKNIKDDPIKKKPDTVFLYFTVGTVTLLMLVGCTTFGWASPAVIKLKSENPDVNPLGRPITTVEISLLAGMPVLSSLIGSYILPRLADIIGRKTSLQIIAIGMFASIVGIAFSSEIYLLIISCSLLFNLFAGVWGILPIYLTEICEDHNRTKFGCLMSACIPLGQLYCYVFGPPFSLRDFTLITAVPLVPFFGLFLFAPESPVYLLSKGKEEDCMKALMKLRGNKLKTELEIDFNKIKLSLRDTIDQKTDLTTLVKIRESRIGLLISMMPVSGQYLCGVPVMMSLLAPIFNGASTLLSGNMIAVIVGVVKCLTFIITSYIIERTGRKPMLVLSSVGSGLSTLLIGLYFYLKYIDSVIIAKLQWLPIASVFLYIISYSLGLGPIPQCVPSEMFLPHQRSTAHSFITAYSNTLYAFYLLVYPLLAEAIGTYACFWIFSGTCFAGAVAFYYVMPETRGKSIMEIQEMLKRY